MSEIKDSGQRIKMAGMVRDTAEDKTKYHLVFDGPMLERWAAHLTKGAKKYSERNWVGAYTKEEQARFTESAVRHFVQWLRGDTDEDHAAAVFFNINGAEHVKEIQDKVARRNPHACMRCGGPVFDEGFYCRSCLKTLAEDAL